RDIFRRDRAIGTGFGLEHDRGAIPLHADILRDDTTEHVGDRSRPIGRDNADGTAREVVLRGSRSGDRSREHAHHDAEPTLTHRASPALCLSRDFVPDLLDRMEPIATRSKPAQAASIAEVFRAGIVIAATPRTTHAKPIHAVGDSVSPRNATLRATPIGTRK